jgi:Protein of unknown function (DUF4239)
MLALVGTVAFCAGVAIAGYYAVLRLAPALSHEQNNELVRVASAVTSGLYGLLIAFMVVNAWQAHNTAATRAEDEISALSNVMRDAGGLPDSLRAPVRADVLGYVNLVVAREWKSLARGQPDLASRARYEGIWARLYDFEPVSDTQRTFFGSLVDRMNDVGRARRLRVYSSRSQVPALLWAVMISGGALTVFLLYLYSSGRRRTQAAVIGIVAGFVGFAMFLIYALDEPFDGAMRLSTQPYTYFVDQWDGKRL